MSSVLRWTVVVVLFGHGLIHLLGAAKGLGWGQVPALREPIGPALGVAWLVAALLVCCAAVLIGRGQPTWWWAVAGLAALVSQVVIVTSWSDAKVGTAADLILVVAAVYGFASSGPTSFEAQWRTQAAQAISQAQATSGAVVTEQDLDGLPEPLAAYIRRSGAVNRPRTQNVLAEFHGRIRSGPDQAWMPFTGRQLNTYGPEPRRVFIMDATRAGLPVTVLHSYQNATATMRAKVLSLLTVVNASGTEMDRGETVTVFNDLVLLAPGAIVDAPVRWTAVDPRHVRGVFTNADQSVSAELVFDAEGDLVDFVSQDRLRASPDGRTFDRQEWSTPLTGHRDIRGRRVPAAGQGRWHAPQPEGAFTYVDMHFDDVAYNVRTATDHVESSPRVKVRSSL